MRLSISLIVVVFLATSPVFAQQIQRSSNPQGVQIQGDTEIKATQENAGAVSVGESNATKNTAGAVKGSTQIQGNVQIHSSQKNTTAVSVGKNNASSNEAGVIGGK